MYECPNTLAYFVKYKLQADESYFFQSKGQLIAVCQALSFFVRTQRSCDLSKHLDILSSALRFVYTSNFGREFLLCVFAIYST